MLPFGRVPHASARIIAVRVGLSLLAGRPAPDSYRGHVGLRHAAQSLTQRCGESAPVNNLILKGVFIFKGGESTPTDISKFENDMVKYSTQKPCEELSDYVRFFWTLEAKVGEKEPFVHRAMPDNCLELIFYCQGKFSIRSLSGEEGNTFTSGVFGHAQKYRQFSTNSDFTLFGVYLYPHSFKMLFNLPAQELTGAMVDCETLWGTEGRILEEKVMLAPDNASRVEIVSNFLLDRIKMSERHDFGFMVLIKKIIADNILISIPSFVSDCNLSRRQLERKFKEFSGFSPKDFFRLVRFKNVLKELEDPNKPLAQIALDSGYYDQSHFTHEFKKYSGYNPREFFINCPEATDTRATRDFKA